LPVVCYIQELYLADWNKLTFVNMYTCNRYIKEFVCKKKNWSI